MASGQGGEFGLEQVLDEYPVLRHAALPEDARDAGAWSCARPERTSPPGGRKRAAARAFRASAEVISAPQILCTLAMRRPSSQKKNANRATPPRPSQEAQPGLFVDGIEHAPPDPLDPGVACDERYPLDRPLTRAPLVRLARIGGIADRQFGLGEGPESHDAPFVHVRRREEAHSRGQDDGEYETHDAPARELTPHAGVVEQRLVAAKGGVSDGHAILLFHTVRMVLLPVSWPRDAPRGGRGGRAGGERAGSRESPWPRQPLNDNS